MRWRLPSWRSWGSASPSTRCRSRRRAMLAVTAVGLDLLLTAPAAADVVGHVGPAEVHLTGSLTTNFGFGLHRESETDVAPGVSQPGDVRGLHSLYTFLDLESE